MHCNIKILVERATATVRLGKTICSESVRITKIFGFVKL